MTDRDDLLQIARAATTTLLTVCTLAVEQEAADDLDVVRRLAHDVVDEVFGEMLEQVQP